MAKPTEQITVIIGADRKKELVELSKKTGINVANQVRGWIYEKLDKIKGE